MNYYTVTCICGKVDSLTESDLTDLPNFCTECGFRLPLPVRDFDNEAYLSEGLRKFADERTI